MKDFSSSTIKCKAKPFAIYYNQVTPFLQDLNKIGEYGMENLVPIIIFTIDLMS